MKSFLKILTLGILMIGMIGCFGTDDEDVSVESVALTPAILSLAVEGTSQLTATVLPSDSTDKTVTWLSSDLEIATVSAGLVTGISAGTTTITVKTTDGKFTKTCEVIVTAGTEELSDPALLETAITVAQALNEVAVEGTELGEYVTGSKATYQIAIDVAQAVVDNTAATQEDIENAMSNLSEATTIFVAGIVLTESESLIVNGDFAAELGDEWKIWGDSGAVSIAIESGELVADVTAVHDANSYDPKVFQAGIAFEDGKSYTLSFDAKAMIARDINVNIGKQLDADPWFNVIGPSETKSLTTEMVTYTIDFTADMTVATTGDIIFELGVGEATKVYIDNVSIEESSVVVEEPSESLIINGDFAAELGDATATAVLLLQSKGVGTVVGMVTQSASSGYSDAINAAQIISADADSTQADIDNAFNALAIATTAFNDSIIVEIVGGADVTALSGAITAADGNLRSTGIGSAEGQALQDDWQAFMDAITSAQVIRDAAADQAVADQAIIDLAAAEVVFNDAKIPAVVVVVDPITPALIGDMSLVYATNEATSFTTALDNWGSPSAITSDYAADPTYSPCIQTVGTGGDWGTATAFTGLTEGIGTYSQLDFKIKTSDFTAISVKVPEVQVEYQLSSGTVLVDGWVQMSILLSDFDTAPVAAEQFAILATGDAAGTYLLTDVGFSGEATTPEPVVWTDITTAATVPADLTDAVVLYSGVVNSITTPLASWSENIEQTEVEIDGNNTLRYLATSMGGPGALGATTSGLKIASLDVSAKTNIHIDFHAVGDVDLLKIKFVSPENEEPAGFASMLDDVFPTNGDWYSIDVALDTIPTAGGAGPVDWAELIQIVIITYGPESTIDEPTGFYVDNMYFY